MIKGSLYSWTSHPIPIIHEYKPLTITIYLNNHQHSRQVILTTFLISAAIAGYCLAMKPLILPKGWALMQNSLRKKLHETWVILPNKWQSTHKQACHIAIQYWLISKNGLAMKIEDKSIERWALPRRWLKTRISCLTGVAEKALFIQIGKYLTRRGSGTACDLSPASCQRIEI